MTRTLFLLSILTGILNAQSGGAPCMLQGVAELTSMHPQYAKTTRDPALDRAITLEVTNANRVFGTRTDLFIYNDAAGSNAYAMPDALTPGWPDGTVAVGFQLMSQELRDSNRGVTLMAIIAHEFGHIVQFKRRPALAGYLLELQADYLAGWYMGQRGASAAAMEEVMAAFFSKGDADFNDRSSHPSPDMRHDAVSTGRKMSFLSLDDAFRRSASYVIGVGTQETGGSPVLSLSMSAFQADLKRALDILRSSRGIASYLGEKMGDDQFSSRLIPTGMRNCTIQLASTRNANIDILTCLSETQSTRSSAEALLQSYQASLTQILGSSMSIDRREDRITIYPDEKKDAYGLQIDIHLLESDDDRNIAVLEIVGPTFRK